MVARLLRQNGRLTCSECRIIQPNVRSNCVFCGAVFSNYEDFVIQEYKDIMSKELPASMEINYD